MSANYGDAVVHDTHYDPLDAIRENGESANALLTRIAAAVENRSLARTIVLPLLSSNGSASVVDNTHPRIRGEWLIICPLHAVTPAVKVGTDIVFKCSYDAGSLQPTAIPFPIIWPEGRDIELYDAASSETTYVLAWIVGTTE